MERTLLAAKKKASAIRSAAVHVDAAHRHADRGDLEAAISSFDRAIELDPDSSEALCGRSGVYAQCQKWDDAVDDAAAAILLIDPKAAAGAAAAASAAVESTVASATIIPASEPSKLAVAYYNRGNAQWGRGQWREACDDCSVALQHQKRFPEALCCRGSGWMQLGELERAVEDFSACLTIVPPRVSITSGDDETDMEPSGSHQRCTALYGRAFARCRLADAEEQTRTATNDSSGPGVPQVTETTSAGWSQAVTDLEELCRIQPANDMARRLLLTAQGRFAKADARAAAAAQQVLMEEEATSSRAASRKQKKKAKKMKKRKEKNRASAPTPTAENRQHSSGDGGGASEDGEEEDEKDDDEDDNDNGDKCDNKTQIDSSKGKAPEVTSGKSSPPVISGVSGVSPLVGVSLAYAIMVAQQQKNKQEDKQASGASEGHVETPKPTAKVERKGPSKKLSATAKAWEPSEPLAIPVNKIASQAPAKSIEDAAKSTTSEASKGAPEGSTEHPNGSAGNEPGVSHSLMSDLLRIEAMAMVQAAVVVGSAMALGNINHREQLMRQEQEQEQELQQDIYDLEYKQRMSLRWDMVSHSSALCKAALEKFATEMKGSLITELQQEYLSAYMWDGLRLRAAEQYEWQMGTPVTLRSSVNTTTGSRTTDCHPQGNKDASPDPEEDGGWISAISHRRRRSKASLMALALGNVRLRSGSGSAQ